MAVAGKRALVFLSGTGETVTTAATTAADGLVFQIAASSWQGQPFDATAAVTVFTSSAGTVSSTAYTLYRLNGTVVFPTSSVNAYTISGTVLPVAQMSAGHGFSYDISRENLDVTTFGSSFRSRIAGVKDISAEVQDFHADLSLASNLATTDKPVAIEFRISSSQAFDARMYALMSGDAVSAAVDGVVDGTVSFEGAADTDGRVITFTTRGTSG